MSTERLPITPRAQAAAQAALNVPQSAFPRAWMDYDDPEAGDAWQILRWIAAGDDAAWATLADRLTFQADAEGWRDGVVWCIPPASVGKPIDLEGET